MITIPVDRVVKNNSPLATLAKLEAQGYISTTATLLLMAFDVDYAGGPQAPQPERDKVYFNDHLVKEQFLVGTNDSWHLNRFEIPIDWVIFPPDPGDHNQVEPAANVIRIEIDTANVTEECFLCAGI